ncbi:MAG TPA: prepilin-type N-terminal cleavage/methylation domain-containing protein, partial [Chromatiales bacterium]|nr:prepilin-type N-terminal cleavage/methylation domain-containing protein [Chromatiales bacterium]
MSVLSVNEKANGVSRCSKAAGFGLVEIMVALVLGLILIAGVL